MLRLLSLSTHPCHVVAHWGRAGRLGGLPEELKLLGIDDPLLRQREVVGCSSQPLLLH